MARSKKPYPIVVMPEDEDKGKTPPPLLVIPELLRHPVYGWLAVYHIYHGLEDGTASYLIGKTDEVSEADARELTFARESKFRKKLYHDFLSNVQLEAIN